MSLEPGSSAFVAELVKLLGLPPETCELRLEWVAGEPVTIQSRAYAIQGATGAIVEVLQRHELRAALVGHTIYPAEHVEPAIGGASR